MNSRRSSAAAIRGPFGADRTDFRDRHERAHLTLAGCLDLLGEAGDRQLPEDLRCARHTLFRRPVTMPLPMPGLPAVFAANAAAFGNMAPPGSSRCPVRTFSTSTSQLASVRTLRARADATVYRGALGRR